MTEEELRVLAWTLLGEASGEGTRGMEAVAHVIRNRSMSGRFPSNPAAVALQRNRYGIHQFSTWNALSMGGNIPRAQWPVTSPQFATAMRVVTRVFGNQPGADPTRGATHYYAHNTISEPYWWRSEAPNGGLKIGNHTFAYKYEPKQAPVPAGPRPAELLAAMHFAGQDRNRQTNPQPAIPSLRVQQSREDAGATVRSIETFVLDPVRGTLVPKPVQQRYSIEEIADIFVRDRNEPEGPDNRGRPIPQGGLSASVANGFTWAGADRFVRPKSNGSASDRVRAAQTAFMPPVPGPDGVENPDKDQTRLMPGVDPFFRGPPDSFPRPLSERPGAAPVPRPRSERPIPFPVTQSDALRAQRAKVAPVPAPRLVRPQPKPQGPLRIEVSGAKPITVPDVVMGANGYVYEQTPSGSYQKVGTVRPAGMTPAEQYAFINAASKQRARNNGSDRGGHISSNDWFNTVTGRN